MAESSLLNPLEAAVMPAGCGCAITKTSFKDLSPTLFEDQGNTAIGMNKVYKDLLRARTVGVAPTTREAYLLGTVKDLKQPIQQRPVPGNSRMINLPYTQRYREANISNEYFKIRDGSGASTGAGGEWTVEVETINDPLYDAPNGAPINGQFIAGQAIYVRYKDGTANPGSQSSYVVPFIVQESNAVGGQPNRAELVVKPSLTTAGWDALSAAEKTALQPQEGLVTIGVNNVDDYEQFCKPEAVEIAPSLITDFHQTSRNAFCYEKEFLEMAKRIENGDINEFYKMFKHLPVNVQNRRRNEKFLRKWYNAIFDNGPLNELQAENAYAANVDPSLTVVDPSDTNCIVGYKANSLGIRQLLHKQGQVIDFKGGALNLDVLFEACYALKRNRQLEGEVVTEIGGITSRRVYDRAGTQILNYIKKRYGDQNINRYYEDGQVISHATGIAMRYMKFDLPEYEFSFVLASDDFFTDREKMMIASGQGSHSGTIELIDWTDLDIGIVATNSVKLTEKDEWAAKVLADLQCTMTQNTKYITLDSTTWTVRFGNEKRSLLVEGFNPDVCFELSSKDCIALPVS